MLKNVYAQQYKLTKKGNVNHPISILPNDLYPIHTHTVCNILNPEH